MPRLSSRLLFRFVESGFLVVAAALTTLPSAAQTETLLHNFASSDGAEPAASLIMDSEGNFYGTTTAGGSAGNGTVFELSQSGGNWTEQVLYSFTGSDGAEPAAGLIMDSAGNLYGTTVAGGTGCYGYGCGVVFELSPSNGGEWTEQVLYKFTGGSDGRAASASLIMDGTGNLYGTTLYGGAGCNVLGCGVVFELSPSNSGEWTEEVLHGFTGGDGANPYAGLIMDAGGNLYGTTEAGGSAGLGTVFKLSQSGGNWIEQVLYSFEGNPGATPYGSLIMDGAGNLYGTTAGESSQAQGTVFQLSQSNGNWTMHVLHTFTGEEGDGAEPFAGLIMDSAGNLYGTTNMGGYSGNGTVFKLFQSGGSWLEQILHLFIGSDGAKPYAGLIMDRAGNLYGTTEFGGSSGQGTIFRVGPTPNRFVPMTPCRIVDTRNANGPFGGPPITGGTFRSFPLAQTSNPCGIPSTATAYLLNVTVVPSGSLGYLTIWPSGGDQPIVSTLNSLDGRIKSNAAIVSAGAPTGSVSVYVTQTANVVLDISGYFTPPTPDGLQFYTLTPCRIVDTRHGQDGGTLQAGVERDYTIPPNCNVPSTAAAYSFNVTVLPTQGSLDYLTVWPQGETQPTLPTLHDNTGTVVANAAIVPAGSNNTTAFYAHNHDTDLVLDINGYFAPPGPGGLSMYPLTPCRVLDTRQNDRQPFQGEKTVDVVGSFCAPPDAQAYILNATVAPPGLMGFLTLWSDGQLRPEVSTLNAYDGFITSNMAIVPTANGSIDAYAMQPTQLILDISGYFAP